MEARRDVTPVELETTETEPTMVGKLPSEIAWTTGNEERQVKSLSDGTREESGTGSSQKIARIRRLAWLLLVISELVMVILISVQLGTFSKAMYQAAQDNAQSELKFIQFHYNDKLDGMARGFKVISQSNTITLLLEGNGSFADVQDLLIDEERNRKIGIINIVDTSKSIVASTNSTLIGVQWDPHGLVSMVLANCSRGQLKLSSTFTADDVLNYGYVTVHVWELLFLEIF
jgi:hypothetical protein